MVVGVCLFHRKFVYDDMRILHPLEREQYLMWLQVSHPSFEVRGNLFFWDIACCAPLNGIADNDRLIGSKRVLHHIMSANMDVASVYFEEVRGHLPVWVRECPRVVFYLPYGYGRMACANKLPSISLLHGWPPRTSLPPSELASFPVSYVLPPQHERFSTGMMLALADDLRSVSALLTPSDETHADHYQILCRWVQTLQSFHDEQILGFMNTGIGGGRIPPHFVEQVLLADCLRSDAALRPVLRSCAAILLPSKMAADIKQRLDDSSVIMSKSQLSKSRFSIDLAYMFLWRNIYRRGMQQAGGLTFYIVTDSSPQFARDFQVALLRHVPNARLPEMMCAATTLCNMWDNRL